MDEKIKEFLKSSPIITKYQVSEEEISELAAYLRENCLSEQVKELVQMVEGVISIDAHLEWKEILSAAAKKIVEFLHAEAASIRIFDPETGKLVAFGSYQYKEQARLKSIPVEKSVAGMVIKSGKSYLVPNILLEPNYANKDIVFAGLQFPDGGAPAYPPLPQG